MLHYAAAEVRAAFETDSRTGPVVNGSCRGRNGLMSDRPSLQPLDRFPLADRRALRVVCFDIDDTLTTDGRLTAQAYTAMERLQKAGLLVVPITGRPAGWCDHIARMWPVDGVVGENGAFYYRYDRGTRRMIRRYAASEKERAEHRRRLDALARRILDTVPGAAIAADQFCREADLAIDYCEDVPPLPAAAVERIVALFEEAGAKAKVSSIHVNGWFGDYDKLTTTRILLSEAFAIDETMQKTAVVFIGDSPNDAPMFAHFPNAVGVANVLAFRDALAAKPTYVTRGRAGEGFAELAAAILAAR